MGPPKMEARDWNLGLTRTILCSPNWLQIQKSLCLCIIYWDKPPHKVLLNAWRNRRIREQLEVGSPLLPHEFLESNSAFRFGSNHGCLLSYPGSPPPVSWILSDTKLYSPMITKTLEKLPLCKFSPFPFSDSRNLYRPWWSWTHDSPFSVNHHAWANSSVLGRKLSTL